MPIVGRKISMILEESVESIDAIGGTIQSWKQIAILYGTFQTRRGEEKLTAGRTGAVISHVFYTQLPTNILGKHNLDMFHSISEGVSSKNRLRFFNRLFDIFCVNSMNFYLQFELVERI